MIHGISSLSSIRLSFNFPGEVLRLRTLANDTGASGVCASLCLIELSCTKDSIGLARETDEIFLFFRRRRPKKDTANHNSCFHLLPTTWIYVGKQNRLKASLNTESGKGI